MEIMTRRQAADLGLLTYNTGKSCAWGHEGIRRTSSGACVGCQAHFKINKPKKVNHQPTNTRKALLAGGYIEKCYVIDPRKVSFMDAIYGLTNLPVSDENLKTIENLVRDYPRTEIQHGRLIFEPVICYEDDIELIRDIVREVNNARKIT